MALKFYNSEKENESHRIEIFGEIGESWFDEGITIQSIANSLKNAQQKPLDIIINSLGGDVDTAFAVHDILKAYKPKKTVDIIGMTASSATIIAMAGDEVRMSKNALGLIHNASTITMGNAEEHRKTMEDLEKVDSIIVGIYRAKSGKPKSAFYEAMEKEQWLTAQEMKDLGLIDKIIEPRDISNSVIEKINNSNLPKIINENSFDMTKELKEFFDKAIADIKNIIKPAAPVESADITALTTENEALKAQIAAFEPQIVEIENKINTTVEENATLAASVTEKETEITNLKKEFADYCKAKGDKAGFVKNGGDEKDYVDPAGTGSVKATADNTTLDRLQNLVEDAKIEVSKKK